MANDTFLLVATFRNEGPNILEWIAHHRLAGFDRIQIYENDSTDTTVRTLRTLDRLGVIEYHPNPHEAGKHLMRACRRSAKTGAFAVSDWCLVLEDSEYLAIHEGNGTLADLVNACPDEADAIMLNWRIFGSAGERRLAPELVTERFNRAELADDIKSGEMRPFRTLFRTTSFEYSGTHLPQNARKDDPVFCNGSGLLGDDFPRKRWRGNDPGCRKYAAIHRYELRDLASFMLKHGDALPSTDHWKEHDLNAEPVRTLSSRTEAVWEEMKHLDDLSGGQLLRLRARALKQWQTAYDALMIRHDVRAWQEAVLAGDTGEVIHLPEAVPVFSSRRASRDAMETEEKKRAHG